MPRRQKKIEESTTQDETNYDDETLISDEEETKTAEEESETESESSEGEEEEEEKVKVNSDSNIKWDYKSISYMMEGSPQRIQHKCNKVKDNFNNIVKIKLAKKIFNDNEESGKNVIGGAWLTDYKSSYDCAISISYEHDNPNDDEDAKQIRSYSHSHDKGGQYTILPGTQATGQKIPLRKEQLVPKKATEFLKEYKDYNSSNLSKGIQDINDKLSLVEEGHPVLDMVKKFGGSKPGKSGVPGLVTVNKEHKDKSLLKLQELYDRAFIFHSLDDFVITASRNLADKWDDLHEFLYFFFSLRKKIDNINRNGKTKQKNL